METGTLYIIATPIGNMEDITLRALRILREETDYVYCEDTRQTNKLLTHYGIRVPLESLHGYSSESKIRGAVKRIAGGDTISYCTDSGTPGLSDPGSRLVKAVREKGLPVIPVPGASALNAIISISGFEEKNIIFAGFLSKKAGKRLKELEKLKEFSGVIIIYESPYRIKKLLQAVGEVFPEAEIVIGRELTKFHEETISGRIGEICDSMDSLKEKGEFTVAVWNR